MGCIGMSRVLEERGRRYLRDSEVLLSVISLTIFSSLFYLIHLLDLANPNHLPSSHLHPHTSSTPTMAPIPTLLAPPGKSTPYTIPAFSGELITIPTSNSTMRLLVTGAETANAFAVVGTGGTQDDPIGFHFHREAHDVFLCLKGSISVWANDKARSLGPGDFASVPPVCLYDFYPPAC
jgi:mannose-6-phosphate isomerase-like protein (cupin superfamily)